MTTITLEPARLRNFFEQFGKIYHGKPIFIPKPELPILDYVRFKEFAEQFSKKYTPVYDAGFSLNLFDVFDFRHDEVKNARILTWLFDPHGSHGQGKSIWHAFLAILQTKKPQSSFLNGENWQNYHVRREVYPQGDSQNRIDLVLKSSNATIYIEVKIYAPEGFEQLERYNRLLHPNGKRIGELVYLTLKGENKQKGEIATTWRELASALKSLKLSKNTPFGFFNSQFCHNISHF